MHPSPCGPPFIFVSYARADVAFVEGLLADLAARGVNCWVDRRDLPPGTLDWEQALREAIHACGAVLLIATPESRRSRYVKAELDLAAVHGRPIYPLWAAGETWIESITLGLSATQFVDARGGCYARGLAELVAALQALPILPPDGERPGMPVTPLAPRAPVPRHNLPPTLTSLIGREAERDKVLSLLAHERLVTLIGAGGVGKTRLALAVATELVGHYADGVWLVEFAPLADPALAVGAAAQALGVREKPGRPLLATLTDHLKDKELLLVLDNCEHLIRACADLASALLRACPGVRLLATSREGLEVGGERHYRAPSLTVPDPRRLPPMELVGSYEAVRLFVTRAQARRQEFVLDERTAPAVAAVCARLDGIPLAIELAAARIGSLPVEAIAERLDQRFRLLTGGPRDAPSRQHTLRAAIDWSWELLSAPEQLLLRRLSVFAGGWALGAVETVCAGDGIEGWEILDLLDGLVNKSLAHLEEGAAEARYGLLETVRQYAGERLEESGERGAARARHLAWSVSLAERAAPALTGPEQGDWLARLEAEHDNLRAALAFGLTEAAQADRALALAGLLWRFWSTHGHLSEGRRWLEGALACAPVAEDGSGMIARARALLGAGVLATIQDNNEPALSLLEQSLDLFRRLDDQQGIAGALNSLGNLAIQQGEYARSSALFSESLARRQELGDTQGIAISLHNLAMVARFQGDYSRASALYGESLTLSRTLGHTHNMAATLSQMAGVALDQADHARAEALYRESLALREGLGDQEGLAHSLRSLADVLLEAGAGAEAVLPLYSRSLTLIRAVDNKWETAHVLEGVARAWAPLEPRGAVHLFSMASALRRTIGADTPPRMRAIHDRSLATLRAALGEAVFSATWAAGEAAPLPGTIDEVLTTGAAWLRAPPAAGAGLDDAPRSE